MSSRRAMKRQSPLPEAVTMLVDEIREPHECIWEWHGDGPGQISVLLIDESEIPKVRHVEQVLGLSWGQGRVPNFVVVAGQWSYESQSRWIA